MRYLKTYNIFESTEEKFFDSIPISKEDISDIFLDVTDLEYKLEFHQHYLTINGKYSKSKKGIGDYYPVIHLTLKRVIHDNSGDVLNWDGGIYYDDKEEVMDAIYHSTSMLRSKLKGIAKVLISIRNINYIDIRIVLDKKSGDSYFSYKEFTNILNKLVSDYNNNEPRDSVAVNNSFNLFNLYYLDNYNNTEEKKYLKISPLRKSTFNARTGESMGSTLDQIINNFIENGLEDNKVQLSHYFEDFFRKLIIKITDKFPIIDFSIHYIDPYRNLYKIYNKITNEVYVEIESDFEHSWDGDYYLGKKSIFKKRQKKFITLFEMEIEIKYLK